MNKVAFVGRAVADPELRYLPKNGKSLTTVKIAIDRPFTYGENKKTDYFKCNIWGKDSEYTANYLRKGKRFGVEGYMILTSYDDKDGKKVYSHELTVNSIEIYEFENNNKQSEYLPREDKDYNSSPKNGLQNNSYNEETSINNFNQIDDDDVPF